jgi:uncharacterized protein YjcR
MSKTSMLRSIKAGRISAGRERVNKQLKAMRGGLSPAAPKGNKNALKHGRYTADAIARRQKISGLVPQ